MQIVGEGRLGAQKKAATMLQRYLALADELEGVAKTDGFQCSRALQECADRLRAIAEGRE